jgi:hypothetical protein
MASELKAGSLFVVIDGEEKFVCDCLLDISSDLWQINVSVVHPREIKLEGIVGTLQEVLADIGGFKVRMVISSLPIALDKNTDFSVHFNA